MKSRPSFLDVYKSLLNGKMRTDMSQKVRIFKAFEAIKNGNKGARTLGLPLVRRALIPAELCFHAFRITQKAGKGKRENKNDQSSCMKRVCS